MVELCERCVVRARGPRHRSKQRAGEGVSVFFPWTRRGGGRRPGIGTPESEGAGIVLGDLQAERVAN